MEYTRVAGRYSRSWLLLLLNGSKGKERKKERKGEETKRRYSQQIKLARMMIYVRWRQNSAIIRHDGIPVTFLVKAVAELKQSWGF
jgi:hypothetical protein